MRLSLVNVYRMQSERSLKVIFKTRIILPLLRILRARKWSVFQARGVSPPIFPANTTFALHARDVQRDIFL